MSRHDASSPFQRRRTGGFSILELIVVLVVVGMLAVFAAPKLLSTQSITLASVSAQLAANIRYTQSLSMSQGQRFRINFTASTYQITDMNGTPIVQPVTAGTAPISVSPAILSGFNPPLTANYIAFDTRGVPYVSASTALISTATISLASGSDTTSITIAPETGRVK